MKSDMCVCFVDTGIPRVSSDSNRCPGNADAVQSIRKKKNYVAAIRKPKKEFGEDSVVFVTWATDTDVNAQLSTL